ncbi:MAG TPA: electron transfer flavoprotein subunit beta/FixA family protein [Vicinamibacterales bacterium]|nr:electron transfer flavoprotein subunit beta/FixA family protein [Vicinamibacterales bacterium]HPK72448.1 electron transfer flavoprotein subunit beta/FixA family protein [Vicinamibacterales bacterium]
MKIAVCLKQVPARDWAPRVDDAGTWVRDQDAGFELNEPDAYALEEGLRLKEQHGGEVVVCSAGPARVSQALREALARGADRAIHVEDDGLAVADPAAVAEALASAMRDEAFDLVLAGLQSDDRGSAQTAVMLAARLGMPSTTIVVDVGVEGPTVRVKRELEGGWFQWVVLPLPALLAVQSGINQLRYATLKGIMAAKKKEIRKAVPPPGLVSRQRIAALHAPERRKQTRMIGGSAADAARALVKALREEARVIP